MQKILMALLVGFALSQSSLEAVGIPPALGESVSEINQILTSPQFQAAAPNTEFVVQVIGDKHRDPSTFYVATGLHIKVITVTPEERNVTYDITYNLTSQVGPSIVEVTDVVRRTRSNHRHCHR